MRAARHIQGMPREHTEVQQKIPARQLCPAHTGQTHLLASALRRCSRIARSRRLRKEQGGFAAAANPKDMFFEHIEIKRKEI
jgi:hypothetical protein